MALKVRMQFFLDRVRNNRCLFFLNTCSENQGLFFFSCFFFYLTFNIWTYALNFRFWIIICVVFTRVEAKLIVRVSPWTLRLFRPSAILFLYRTRMLICLHLLKCATLLMSSHFLVQLCPRSCDWSN